MAGAPTSRSTCSRRRSSAVFQWFVHGAGGLWAVSTVSGSSYLLDLEMRAKELRALGALARMIPVRRLAPHADSHRLGQLCDVILEDLRSGDARV